MMRRPKDRLIPASVLAAAIATMSASALWPDAPAHAQATLPPGAPPLGGAPILQAPPTVIPQNPTDSRVPNLGSGGGTLGRPSAIQNPLGYDDSLYFRRPKPPAQAPVVLPPPAKRIEPPPAASTPRAIRRKPKKEDD